MKHLFPINPILALLIQIPLSLITAFLAADKLIPPVVFHVSIWSLCGLTVWNNLTHLKRSRIDQS